jgi:hypothetical protein
VKDIDLTPAEVKVLDDAAPTGAAVGERYSAGACEHIPGKAGTSGARGVLWLVDMCKTITS